MTMVPNRRRYWPPAAFGPAHVEDVALGPPRTVTRSVSFDSAPYLPALVASHLVEIQITTKSSPVKVMSTPVKVPTVAVAKKQIKSDNHGNQQAADQTLQLGQSE
jgi:hypothetical protein